MLENDINKNNFDKYHPLVELEYQVKYLIKFDKGKTQIQIHARLA